MIIEVPICAPNTPDSGVICYSPFLDGQRRSVGQGLKAPSTHHISRFVPGLEYPNQRAGMATNTRGFQEITPVGSGHMCWYIMTPGPWSFISRSFTLYQVTDKYHKDHIDELFGENKTLHTCFWLTVRDTSNKNSFLCQVALATCSMESFFQPPA